MAKKKVKRTLNGNEAIDKDLGDFFDNGGTVGGTIVFPQDVTRQLQQAINMRSKDYVQRSGLSNYNGYPCWSSIIEDPSDANNTNGLLFMLGTGVEGDAYRDNYLRPLKMGYGQKNNIGSVNIPWDDMHLKGISKKASGHTRLPNGLILQWGQFQTRDVKNTDYNVTFPIAFPNGFLCAVPHIIGQYTTGAWEVFKVAVGYDNESTTTTKFTFRFRREDGTTNAAQIICTYFALGY